MAAVTLRCSVILLLLTVLPGHAQTTANGVRSTTIADERMRSVFQGMRIEFTEDSSGGETTFTLPLNGRMVTLRNHVSSMLLSACFQGGADPLKKNQWNREHFSTGAYFDENGCLALRSELFFSGGVTNQMIEKFVREFGTDVAIFARLVALSPPGPNKPSDSAAAAVPSPDRPQSPIATMAWSQLGPDTKPAPPEPGTVQSVPGLLRINRKISLKYDPSQWTQTASSGEAQFTFSYASGAAHALVIAERTAVPLDSLADIALANAQLADPNAQIVYRGKRRVNGVALWFLKIEAEADTVPMVYCGYFYAAATGAVQVVTYAGKTRFPEYETAFLDFLDGLAVLEGGSDHVLSDRPSNRFNPAR
jgi:hypothetical protein